MDQLKNRLKRLLPPERYAHSLRVEEAALKLARHYGVPAHDAAVAALLHDCSRFLNPKQMLIKARAWGLKFGPMEVFQPKLLHAKLSAVIARKDFGIKDKKILRAIERHTVGTEKMSRLDKVIYLADHIEGRRDFDGVEKIRKLAFKDMDQAVAESTGAMIMSLVKKGLPVSEETIRTRNAHLKI